MNAALAEPWVEIEAKRRRAEAERWERRGLEIELNRWGKWIEATHEYQGYPGMDILAAMLYGCGGGQSSHRILCLDMPVAVYAVHGRLLRLTEKYQEAIYLRYAVRMKEDGTFWTEAEICARSGIQRESFERRLRRAKGKLLGIDTDPIDEKDIA